MSKHAAELLTFEALVKECLPSLLLFLLELISSQWNKITQLHFSGDGVFSQFFFNAKTDEDFMNLFFSLSNNLQCTYNEIDDDMCDGLLPR